MVDQAGDVLSGALAGPQPHVEGVERQIGAQRAGRNVVVATGTLINAYNKAKAEVTAGGISTAGLSSRTMEARAVPGLYAIGEAVDVTGWLGGYNFQWAWSSGWAAGQAIAQRRAG